MAIVRIWMVWPFSASVHIHLEPDIWIPFDKGEWQDQPDYPGIIGINPVIIPIILGQSRLYDDNRDYPLANAVMTGKKGHTATGCQQKSILKRRYVHWNIGRRETAIGTTLAAMRSGKIYGLSTPKFLNAIVGGSSISGGAAKSRMIVFWEHKALKGWLWSQTLHSMDDRQNCAF
jgi:hypothetical protein